MTLGLFSLPTIIARLGSWNAILLGVFAMAVYFVIVTAIEKIRKIRTKNWPTTAGATCDVEKEFVPGGVNGVDYWRVNFHYTYSVGGTDYKGKYHVNFTSESMREQALAGITRGPVIVHYDPANPAKGVLWEDDVWNLW